MLNKLRFFFSVESLVPFILCMMIFNRYSIDVGFRMTPIYFLLPFLVLYLIFWKVKYVKFSLIEFSFIPFYFFCLLSFFYSVDQELSFRFSLGLFLVLTTFIVVRAVLMNSSQQLSCILYQTGIFYVSFSVIWYVLGVLSMKVYMEHHDFYGVTIEKSIPRMIGFNNDPNICALIFLFFSFLFYFSKERFAKVFFYVSFLCLMLTLSRGGAAAFFAGFFVIFIMGSKFEKLKFIFIGGGAIFFVFILAFLYPDSYELFIEKRLSGLEEGGGRFQIWANAFSLVDEKPILGYGIFSFRAIMEHHFGISKFAHNTFVEVVLELGLLGFILFTLPLLVTFFFCVKLTKINEYKFLLPAYVSLLVAMNGLSIYINIIFLFFILVISVATYKLKVGVSNG